MGGKNSYTDFTNIKIHNESIYKMCLSRSKSVKINCASDKKHCVYWGLSQWKISWDLRASWRPSEGGEGGMRQPSHRRQYRDRLLLMDITDLDAVWTHHIIHYTLHYARQGNKRSDVMFSVKLPLLGGIRLWDTKRSFVWMLPYKPKWCWHFTNLLESRAEVNRLVQRFQSTPV